MVTTKRTNSAEPLFSTSLSPFPPHILATLPCSVFHRLSPFLRTPPFLSPYRAPEPRTSSALHMHTLSRSPSRSPSQSPSYSRSPSPSFAFPLSPILSLFLPLALSVSLALARSIALSPSPSRQSRWILRESILCAILPAVSRSPAHTHTHTHTCVSVCVCVFV